MKETLPCGVKGIVPSKVLSLFYAIESQMIHQLDSNTPTQIHIQN